jgi:hypothetical protein
MKKILSLSLLLITSLVSSQSQINMIAGGVPYCAEYQAVYDAYTTKPDDATATIYNTMVEKLVAAGLWSTQWDIVRGYGMTTNAAGEALINWINPATFGATAYNAPTFTALQGFAFNGTTQYISQIWVPSTNGVRYTRNSASQVLYIRTTTQKNARFGVYGSTDTKDMSLNPSTITTGYALIRTNDQTNTTLSTLTNSAGLFVNTRVAASGVGSKLLYRNGVNLISVNVASTGVPTHSPYTGAGNTDNVAQGFREDQVFFEAWGAGLSQAQVTTLNTIIEEAADALGVGVQSPTMLVFVLILMLYIGNRKKFTYEKADRYIDPGLRRAA